MAAKIRKNICEALNYEVYIMISRAIKQLIIDTLMSLLFRYHAVIVLQQPTLSHAQNTEHGRLATLQPHLAELQEALL